MQAVRHPCAGRFHLVLLLFIDDISSRTKVQRLEVQKNDSKAFSGV